MVLLKRDYRCAFLRERREKLTGESATGYFLLPGGWSPGGTERFDNLLLRPRSVRHTSLSDKSAVICRQAKSPD